MNYYFTRQLKLPLDECRARVEKELPAYGFGIVSEIAMHEKFKGKLNVDYRPYLILGACSPKHAYEAVQSEEHIGLMLPCNIVLQEKTPGQTQVSVVDPVASMMAIENPALASTAGEIREKLKDFLENLE
ncbi:MAG: DUF302 domain-containing protein [Bacteroidales bacterium]|nr:DUF302 domain-containing protein [Bacteroidales bacterium]